MKWQESIAAGGGRTAGFKKRAGVECEDVGVFEEAIAAVVSQVMWEQRGEGWEWVEREMRSRIGFWKETEAEVDQLWKWIPKRKKDGGYDMSEGARMVYIWG